MYRNYFLLQEQQESSRKGKVRKILGKRQGEKGLNVRPPTGDSGRNEYEGKVDRKTAQIGYSPWLFFNPSPPLFTI